MFLVVFFFNVNLLFLLCFLGYVIGTKLWSPALLKGHCCMGCTAKTMLRAMDFWIGSSLTGSEVPLFDLLAAKGMRKPCVCFGSLLHRYLTWALTDRSVLAKEVL